MPVLLSDAEFDTAEAPGAKAELVDNEVTVLPAAFVERIVCVTTTTTAVAFKLGFKVIVGTTAEVIC